MGKSGETSHLSKNKSIIKQFKSRKVIGITTSRNKIKNGGDNIKTKGKQNPENSRKTMTNTNRDEKLDNQTSNENLDTIENSMKTCKNCKEKQNADSIKINEWKTLYEDGIRNVKYLTEEFDEEKIQQDLLRDQISLMNCNMEPILDGINNDYNL